ncbi:Major Facilitator Superfamily protein [compost metagenome]
MLGIFSLGLLQLLAYGGSFFLMAVMAGPIMRETGWASQWVYGALSLSILVSALLAPLASRLIARFGGRNILASSGLVLASGLLLMAGSTSLPMFLWAWMVIGVGMALGLFEALLATLAALYGERSGRAITGITLISGFATTLCWPVVALAIEHLGWRMTCQAYAGVLAISVAPLYLWVLPAGRGVLATRSAAGDEEGAVERPTYLLLTATFAVGAVIMTAMSVHLLALLQGQGFSLAVAIGLSALVGPSQVGARFVQVFWRTHHPVWLALVSVVLVAIGLLLVLTAPLATALGLVLFGAGNGLRPIIRGLLPLALMSPATYVRLMGRMARPSLIAQALTPLVGGYLLQVADASSVLLGVCALALFNVLLVLVLARRVTPAVAIRTDRRTP